MPSIRRITNPGAGSAGVCRLVSLTGVVIAGCIIAAAGFAPCAVAHSGRYAANPIRLAQEAMPEEAVPADQINKYIAVYTSMQRNHSLTVDQAASKQGLTVDQFRDIENRIERNPVAHERVLDALKKASKKATPAQ